jgi:hypothetical protein
MATAKPIRDRPQGAAVLCVYFFKINVFVIHYFDERISPLNLCMRMLLRGRCCRLARTFTVSRSLAEHSNEMERHRILEKMRAQEHLHKKSLQDQLALFQRQVRSR